MKLIIYWLLATLALADSTKYCSKNCSRHTKHIACGNKGKFTKKCPSNARLIDMTPYKTAIVKMHNRLRNRIASGRKSAYLPAARMATMQWDDELAYLATLNVKGCDLKHDNCHNTDNFPTSGQNLGKTYYTGDERSTRDSSMLFDHIRTWYKEHKNSNMSFINKYPTSYSGPLIGHFTIMVAESNTHVGCAAARWTAHAKNNFYLACNYGANNILDNPVYNSSTKATSGCRTGKHHIFRSLCSTKEKY